ncbi:MAG TPA: DUF885 domain-containing protein [Acidimicrobiia bacterium]
MSTAFQIASDLVDDTCALNPILCTQLGIPGSDGEWRDIFSVAGTEQTLEMHERYRSLVEPFLGSDDPKERLAARVMIASFDETRAAYDAGDHFRDLRHLASPFHQIRLVFDVMKTDTRSARENIVRRLDTVEKPLGDYRTLLDEGLARGVVVARRQVESIVAQARRISEDPASIDEIVSKLEAVDGPSETLAAAAEGARATYTGFADWLETHYLPNAPADDGVGREIYVRAADRLVGMEVDPDEAYLWGWEEFRRLRSEMVRVADLILPGAGIEATNEHLENDPSITISGTEELLSFVDTTLRGAVDELAGSHFDVPDEIRPLSVNLAPTGSPLGVYYRPPSEDFSRPGSVWYSIGDQAVFPLYQHVSTAYHEGFPGHHLQKATAMYRREDISRFQRLLTWYPGYGEGWGMYAEVLMGELGFLENPQHYFGMLAKQMYRAARVVVDIGLHLGKTVDESSPLAAGEPWTFENAVEFIRVYGFRTAAQARDEVLRYLGWPGQAIAYKLGEREVLAIREKMRHALGPNFDLKGFHSTLIGNGAMRLDLLGEVVAERMLG